MIQLPLATAVTEVHVAAPTEEEAEVQIQEQEKQRVLGVIPNFYVTYDPNAVALRPKQKFELAWKTTIDPVTLFWSARWPASSNRKTHSADTARARKATPSATAPVTRFVTGTLSAARFCRRS